MKESWGKVGKNALNEEVMWDELLYFGPKPFKFWALILGTGGSIIDCQLYTWLLYVKCIVVTIFSHLLCVMCSLIYVMAMLSLFVFNEYANSEMFVDHLFISTESPLD